MKEKNLNDMKKKLFEAKKEMSETLIEAQRFFYLNNCSNEFTDGCEYEVLPSVFENFNKISGDIDFLISIL